MALSSSPASSVRDDQYGEDQTGIALGHQIQPQPPQRRNVLAGVLVLVLFWLFTVSLFPSSALSLQAAASVFSVVVPEQLGFCFVFILSLSLVQTERVGRKLVASHSDAVVSSWV